MRTRVIGWLGRSSNWLFSSAQLVNRSTLLPSILHPVGGSVSSLSSSTWSMPIFRQLITPSSVPDFNKNPFIMNMTLELFLAKNGSIVQSETDLRHLIAEIWKTAYASPYSQTTLANDNIKLVLYRLDAEKLRSFCAKAASYAALCDAMKVPDAITALNTKLGRNHLSTLFEDMSDLLACQPSILHYITSEKLRELTKSYEKQHALLVWSKGTYHDDKNEEKSYLRLCLQLLGDAHVMKHYGTLSDLANDLTSDEINGKELNKFLKEKLSGLTSVTQEELRIVPIPFRIGAG